MSLFSVLFAFLVVVSLSSQPVAHRGEPSPLEPPWLPKRETDFVCSKNRDYVSLLLTLSLGLTSIASLIFPPLPACYVMDLLCNTILLPCNLPASAKCKHNDSSSLCRKLIVLLLIISGNVHVNPGPVIASSAALHSNDLCFNDFCSRNNMGFLHVSVRSLVPKMDQHKVWVESSKPDFLVQCETWLRKSMAHSEINIPGYNLFQQDRSSKGGGVAIYSKEHLHCTIALAKSIPKQFELLVIQVRLSNNFSFTVAGCYRPPSAPACTLEALSSALAPFTRSELVLLGDLNRDMLKPPEKVIQQFDALNLHQIITHPTRLNPKSPDKATLLDLILTKSPHMCQSGVFCNGVSDHCAIACIRSNCSVKQPTHIISKRVLKHFDDLATVKWFRIGLIPSVHDAWTLFHDLFINVVNWHAPIKKIQIKNRLSPWIDRELAVLLQNRNAAWCKARLSKLPADWLAFRQIRNKALQAVRKSKVSYFTEKFSLSSLNPKRFWKTVRELENKPPSQLPQALNVDNIVISDKSRMSDIFNQHFIKSGFIFESTNTHSSTNRLTLPSPRLSPPTTAHASPTSLLAPPQVVTLRAVAESEVLVELLKLDPKKPAGSDDLDPFFFRTAAPIVAAPIADLFNLSILTAEVPSAWKMALVRPIFKGGDHSDLNCYRPISILPCLSKVMEKLVNKQLTGYLTAHSILSDVQSGFRSGFGCVTATLKVLNDITSALDSKLHCAAVLIDLAKAFDTVDHSILADRLSSIGIRGLSLSWLSNYLSGRFQCVKSDNLFSQPLPVTKGVPQGLILAPTLFSIYINDIVHSALDSSVHLYADDTILYAVGSSPDMVIATLQDSFNKIQQAFSSLHLLLNTKKTKVIWFGRKGSATPIGHNITTLEGTSLDH